VLQRESRRPLRGDEAARRALYGKSNASGCRATASRPDLCFDPEIRAFDSSLTLQHSAGKTGERNDDISDDDSNARIIHTARATATYRIIAYRFETGHTPALGFGAVGPMPFPWSSSRRPATAVLAKFPRTCLLTRTRDGLQSPCPRKTYWVSTSAPVRPSPAHSRPPRSPARPHPRYRPAPPALRPHECRAPGSLRPCSPSGWRRATPLTVPSSLHPEEVTPCFAPASFSC
jgi:hypothetical protein